MGYRMGFGPGHLRRAGNRVRSARELVALAAVDAGSDVEGAVVKARLAAVLVELDDCVGRLAVLAVDRGAVVVDVGEG